MLSHLSHTPREEIHVCSTAEMRSETVHGTIAEAVQEQNKQMPKQINCFYSYWPPLA